MKKILLLMLVALILVPSEGISKEKSPFRVYLDERTTENFLKAFEHYEDERADTVNYGSAIVLAYMSLIELEKNLEILEENKNELKNRNLFSYGNILLELDRFEESIAIYEVLNEKSPKWSCPWRHKGEAYWKKGDLEEAVKALEKAIETRETHYDAYVMLAEVLRDQGKYEEALETLEKGLTYYGKDIEDPEEEVSSLEVAFLHLDLLEKCGRTAGYEELLEKVKKIAPDDERLK
jgi:tetratricopeptide (TPR) repeat protein